MRQHTRSVFELRPFLRWLLPALLLFSPALAHADYLSVKHATSLKSGPSASSDPVVHVDVGDTLKLVSVKLKGNYYHATASSGKKGWVYKGFVTLEAGSPPAPPPTPTTPTAPAVDGTLKIRIIDVGQGDSILITCPHGTHQMLIDTGDWRYPGARKAFKSAMTEFQPTADPIEVVVATHPHSDHIGTMEWLLREYKVGLYIDDGVPSDKQTYKDVEQAIHDRNVNRHTAAANLDIDFCPLTELSARILMPSHFGDSDNPNNDSVVLRIDYGQDSFLFVGDSEIEEENELLATPSVKPLLNCEFLKVGHHGSDTSSSKAFLDAVTPDVAVMSPGAPETSTNTTYMHPRRSTVERLLKYVRHLPGPTRTLDTFDPTGGWGTTSIDGALYSTSMDGDVLIESNGHGLTVHTSH